MHNLIDTSEILYIDPNKKRTQNWLGLTKLQLPFVPNQYEFISKISLIPKDVKGNFAFESQNKQETE